LVINGSSEEGSSFFLPPLPIHSFCTRPLRCCLLHYALPSFAAHATCPQEDQDQYGRVVAVCYLPLPDGSSLDLNGWLVQQGLAVAYRRAAYSRSDCCPHRDNTTNLIACSLRKQRLTCWFAT
jgi:endonuclease YncB( thermonuclease family)